MSVIAAGGRVLLARRASSSRQLIGSAVLLLLLLVRQAGAADAGAAAGRHDEGVAPLDGRLGEVVGVVGLEPPVLHHGLEHAGIQQLGLFDDALDHLLASGLGLGLDEADHGDVALDLDVLAEVQAVGGGTQLLQANLALLGRLDAGLVAGDAVLVAHVDAERDVDVGLQAPGHVVEAAVEGDLAGADVAHAGDELDALGYLVPGAVVLVGGGIARRGDGLVAEDEGIQGDDLAVGVEDVEGQLTGDEAGDGRDDREGLLLAKHLGGKSVLR